LGNKPVVLAVACLEITRRLLVQLEAVPPLVISLLLLLVPHRRGVQPGRVSRFSDRQGRSQAASLGV
jgi:hypothetical protein